MAGTDHRQKGPSEAGPVIILVEPQLGENIGTSARAMANFGLSELRLVKPRDGWPSNHALKAASGADWIIERAQVFEDTPTAIRDLSYVYATTARPRDMVKPVITPEQAGENMRYRAGLGERVGILFGRERFGLRNEEVALADAIVMAPVNPAFASLNIAQAVLLLGYEWYKRGSTSIGQQTPQAPAYAGPHMPMGGSRPATKEELEGFFEHLKSELLACGFLRPPEKVPSMMRNIRNMFQRANLTEQEVRTLRGMVAGLAYTHSRGKPANRKNS